MSPTIEQVETERRFRELKAQGFNDHQIMNIIRAPRITKESIKGKKILPPINLTTKPGFEPRAGSLPSPTAALSIVQGVKDMGFFSSIGKFLGKVAKPVISTVSNVLGFGATAAKQAPTVIRNVLPSVAGGLAGGAAFGAASQLFDSEGNPVPGVINPATGAIGAMGGGNGRFATVTTVTTIDTATGQPVKQKVLQGSPFLMSKEVAHMKSVFRKINRVHGKMPSKTRKPSMTTMLKDAIQDKMMHTIQGSVAQA